MTVQANQVQPAAAEAGSVSGIVLASTKRVLDVYGQVKDLSPMLKTSLETVESRVPEEWAGRLEAASAPVLTFADEQYDVVSARVGKTVADVNGKVAQVVADVNEKIVAPARDAVTTRVIEPVTTRVIEPVSASVTKTVADVNEKMVGVRAAVTTRVADVQAVQWKDLRGDLTRKAVERLERGFLDIKEFSATKGKDMIHIDLIAYSRATLDQSVAYSTGVVANAKAAANPILAPVTENVVKAVEVVKSSVVALQEAAAEASVKRAEELVAVRAKLQERLAAAIEGMVELRTQGLALVAAKYGEVFARMPEKEALGDALLAKLPVSLHPSVRVLLSFNIGDVQGISAISDVLASDLTAHSRRAIDRAAALVQAVKDVVFAPVAQ